MTLVCVCECVNPSTTKCNNLFCFPFSTTTLCGLLVPSVCALLCVWSLPAPAKRWRAILQDDQSSYDHHSDEHGHHDVDHDGDADNDGQWVHFQWAWWQMMIIHGSVAAAIFRFQACCTPNRFQLVFDWLTHLVVVVFVIVFHAATNALLFTTIIVGTMVTAKDVVVIVRNNCGHHVSPQQSYLSQPRIVVQVRPRNAECRHCALFSPVDCSTRLFWVDTPSGAFALCPSSSLSCSEHLSKLISLWLTLLKQLLSQTEWMESSKPKCNFLKWISSTQPVSNVPSTQNSCK